MDKDISVEKLHDIIANYKGKKLGTNVEVSTELGVINEGLGPILGLYFFYKSEKENYSFKRCIDPMEVHLAIVDYVESLNCDLVTCQYVGGIKREDLIKGPDIPYFDGLKLQIRERGISRLLNKKEQ